MKVIAKKNRELALINAQNTQNENRAEIITLVVPEEYEDYNKKIVFVTDDGTVWDVITNNEYKITNAITKYDKVDFYIWLTKEVDGESIDFRTKTKTLNFYHNVDASDEITDEEIHGVNTVVNLLEEEIEKVENLNIEATKIGDTTTITITKKDGTTESVEINDGADGQDGYTPQKGIDYFTEQDIEEIEGDILNEVYTKSETDTLLQEKADVEDIPDVSSFITKDVNDLTNYTLKTNTGSLIDLEINDTTYVVTLKLKNQDGTIISTDTIDLPLESVVVGGSYDSTNKKIVLTLENGSTVDIPVGDLISGLQTEITSSNKLASDLIDDSNSGNKFTNTSEKLIWNGKYDKPNGGIPKTDLASDVQTSLGKADTAIQEHQDISGKEDKTNKVTSIDNTSTDTQYPSAKCVYDSQEEQNTNIEALQTENARLKATLPTTTGEGQDITLDKTAELEFIKPPLPMGNSEQDGEPSPSNEVPITNVTGDVEVVIENKNLFDYNNITPKAYYEFYSTTNTLSLKTMSKAFCEKIIVNESEKFTFSITNNYSERIRYYIFVADKNMNYITNYAWGNGLNASASWQRPFTLPEKSKYLLISILDFPDELNAKDYIEVQVEQGLTKTDYIEGKSQTFTFPLGNEKLMLGDYLADDGIHHVRGQVVYNGSEDWIIRSDTSTNDFLCCRISGYLKDTWKSIFLCSYFEVKKSTDSTHNNIRLVNADGYGAQITISRNIAATVNDFKNWLTEQYNNNSPVIVEYELNEEVIVPYTSAQQEVYNQIKQSLSYEEQTNISSNQNALFSVEAYQNTKLILQDISNAIVALGGV